MLWALGWVIWAIRGMGEFLGIWESIGRGIKDGFAWIRAKIDNI